MNIRGKLAPFDVKRYLCSHSLFFFLSIFFIFKVIVDDFPNLILSFFFTLTELDLKPVVIIYRGTMVNLLITGVFKKGNATPVGIMFRHRNKT